MNTSSAPVLWTRWTAHSTKAQLQRRKRSRAITSGCRVSCSSWKCPLFHPCSGTSQSAWLSRKSNGHQTALQLQSSRRRGCLPWPRSKLDKTVSRPFQLRNLKDLACWLCIHLRNVSLAAWLFGINIWKCFISNPVLKCSCGSACFRLLHVIDLLCPYGQGGKVGLFGGAGVGKTVIIMEMINKITGAFPEICSLFLRLCCGVLVVFVVSCDVWCDQDGVRCVTLKSTFSLTHCLIAYQLRVISFVFALFSATCSCLYETTE